MKKSGSAIVDALLLFSSSSSSSEDDDEDDDENAVALYAYQHHHHRAKTPKEEEERQRSSCWRLEEKYTRLEVKLAVLFTSQNISWSLERHFGAQKWRPENKKTK